MPFPHFISLRGRGFRALRFAAAKRPGGCNAGRAWRQSGPAVPATALREHVPHQGRSDSERRPLSRKLLDPAGRKGDATSTATSRGRQRRSCSSTGTRRWSRYTGDRSRAARLDMVKVRRFFFPHHHEADDDSLYWTTNPYSSVPWFSLSWIQTTCRWIKEDKGPALGILCSRRTCVLCDKITVVQSTSPLG